MPPIFHNVDLSDGRVVDVLVGGAADGPALVLHHGTPHDASIWHEWDDVARASELRLIAASRPGYAHSTRVAGRRVADVAADIGEILTTLDVPWFVTAGWSGGGPHALACAALVPNCRAATTLAGVGPAGEPDLEFSAGMGPENVSEFGAARGGETVLRDWMEQHGGATRTVTGSTLIAVLGGLIPEADKAVLIGGFADRCAAAHRRALATGFDGWIDDDLSFVAPWGFDPAAIDIPVTVWQGDLDLMVPLAHGCWLAQHVPGSSARFLPGHGHVSLVVRQRDEIVRDLLARSRAA